MAEMFWSHDPAEFDQILSALEMLYRLCLEASHHIVGAKQLPMNEVTNLLEVAVHIGEVETGKVKDAKYIAHMSQLLHTVLFSHNIQVFIQRRLIDDDIYVEGEMGEHDVDFPPLVEALFPSVGPQLNWENIAMPEVLKALEELVSIFVTYWEDVLFTETSPRIIQAAQGIELVISAAILIVYAYTNSDDPCEYANDIANKIHSAVSRYGIQVSVKP